ILSRLQPAGPAALVRINTKRLAKNPDARWQSAGDLADALKWSREENSAGAAVSSTRQSKSSVWRWATPIAVARAARGVTLLLLSRRDIAVQPVRRFSILPPAELGFTEAPIAFSPHRR